MAGNSTSKELDPRSLESGSKLRYQSPKLTKYGSVKDLTASISGTGPGDGATKKNATSERRLKENIVKVGVHPAGFGLYLFDYKAEYRDMCGHGRQFGVMVDEVQAYFPDCVSRNEMGFLAVDYRRLGIE